MSKRAPQFERRERDFYPTPAEAVAPLLPHLAKQTWYIEPCVGDGALIMHLLEGGHFCADAFDVEPDGNWTSRTKDARDTQYEIPGKVTHFITNPPWARHDLHAIILNLSKQLPTWLLFDADWMHTRQAIPYMALCQKIVSVGRVKWIPDSKFTGKDNACWYLFDAKQNAPAQFVGRAA